MKTLLSIMGLAGFTMYAIGIFLQTRKILASESVTNISMGEVRFRTCASILSTIGVCISGNPLLITGTLLNCAAMLRYCYWAHRFHKLAAAAAVKSS